MNNWNWTARGSTGTKLVIAGALAQVAKPHALAAAQGNDLLTATAYLGLGVGGGVIAIVGLYFIATRNRNKQ
ncbi:hypothetical protein [Ralstonia solanacearum]|uniref:Uncharacterized protein n=1 Tax=Ralstonia solanacearum TaxID=305 RepID=A0AAE3NDV9_RALSL|nr:hypothetical protein [Ralstonia solanacearum]MBB6583801.1 hypothetical protein [Ralstonia solanacearum]MDB0521767.1 hypothetical protein [Ralstonia solanacearum]